MLDRKSALFDRFSANLGLYVPGAPEVFVCPICLAEFNKASLNAEPSPLSLGHVWPDSMGGGLTTLECRKCNNTLGSKADRALVEYSKLSKFQADGGIRNGVVSIGGNELRCQITKTGTNWEIVESSGHNHPLISDKVRDNVKNLESIALKVSFRIPGTSVTRDLGIVHSAYLQLFHVLGYEYALSAGGKWVANQLLLGKLHSECRRGIRVHSGGSSLCNLPEFTIATGTIAESCRCVAAVLPDWTGQGGRTVVILPAFNTDDVDRYQNRLSTDSQDILFNFCALPLMPESSLFKASQKKWFGNYLLAMYVSQND